MSKQTKQSFLYGSTILMISMLIVKAVGVVFHIPLLNIIGFTGNGIFTSSYTVYTTVYALTVTGLSAGVARMVAAKAALGEYRDVRKMFRIATLLFLLLGILGALLVWFSAGWFSVLIDNPDTVWAVMAIAPAIFFCCLMASYRGYYEGLQNMTPTAVTQVVEVIAKLIAGLGGASLVMGAAKKQFAETGTVFGKACVSAEAAEVAAAPFGAAGAMLGVSISALVGFLFIFLRSRIKGDGITKAMLQAAPPAHPGRELAKGLIRIAVPVTLGAVVVQLSALIDTFTIQNRLVRCSELDPSYMLAQYGGCLKDGEEIHKLLYGVFGACVTLFNVVPAFTNIFGKSALPNVTAAWTRQDRLRIKHNVESVIRMTMLIAAPLSMGLCFLAGPILQLLYGAKEPHTALLGGGLMSVLAIGALFLSLVTPLNAIMQGMGRADLPVKYLLAGVAVKLGLNWILIGIPKINIMGSAISTLVCYALIAFLSLFRLHRMLPVTIDYAFVLGKPLLAGIICGFGAYICEFLLTSGRGESIITLVSIGVGALFYGISLVLLRAISREDLKLLPNGKKIRKVLEKMRVIR